MKNQANENLRNSTFVGKFVSRWLGFFPLLLAIGLCPLGATRAAESTDLPEGDFVARVYYNQVRDLERLSKYDVHEYNNLAEQWVRVSANRDIFEQLAKEGWRITVDVGATRALNPVSMLTFFGGYRTVDELYSSLESTVSNYPAITQLVTYGQSHDKLIGGDSHGGHFLAGYDLKAIHITNRQIPGPKPVFFLMADIHAREITTSEVAMRFLDWLVQGYGTNADATWLVDYHDTYIVPTANPDGHWIVELGGSTNPFYQRKNADRGGSTYWPPTIVTQYGVDCNRNHSFKWNQGGASTNPLDQTYCGKLAASEPEVYSLQTFIQSLVSDQRGNSDISPAPDSTTGILISLHSYGDEVLWPWGHTVGAAPNASGLQAIGKKFASYNSYEAFQSYQLYPTTGTSDDWAYGTLGIPAFTFEMGQDFMPPYREVDSVQWPTNRPAFIYACKIARTPYATVRGPDALNLTATAALGGVTVHATVDDSKNGRQTIMAAQCAVDIPWWGTNATPIDMVSSGGFFNSTAVSVEAFIPEDLLKGGKHIVFVRGSDSAGNWGPPSALFIDLRTSAPVLNAHVVAGQAIFSWDSLTNYVYSVEARDGFENPWEATAFAQVPGTGFVMSYTNTDASATRWFRLKAGAEVGPTP